MKIRLIHDLALIALILSVLAASSIRLAKAEELTYDVNGDGKVDLQDLMEVSKAFASYPERPNWNPKVDFNKDNKIDITDCALTAAHFGQTRKVLVAPEYSIGPILGLAGCFAAFGLFLITKPKHQ